MYRSRGYTESRRRAPPFRIGGTDNFRENLFSKNKMHPSGGESKMPEPTAEPMTDGQWTDYLSEVLSRLSAHAEQLPADATLRELIEATCEPLGLLLGYFAAG